MIRKQIIATSGVDRQNQQLSIEVLAENAKAFSAETAVTRMSINHDCTLLPIGKILSGSLKQLDSGDVALEVYRLSIRNTKKTQYYDQSS